MADEKKLDLDAVEENARLAEEQAEKETQGEAQGVYVHHFKKPFTIKRKQGDEVVEQEVTELTFDWESLSGADHNAACAVVTQRTGLMVVVREYTPPYLTEMAARACTLRKENGKRMVFYADMERMRLCDLTAIQDEMRRFLRQSGS